MSVIARPIFEPAEFGRAAVAPIPHKPSEVEHPRSGTVVTVTAHLEPRGKHPNAGDRPALVEPLIRARSLRPAWPGSQFTPLGGGHRRAPRVGPGEGDQALADPRLGFAEYRSSRDRRGDFSVGADGSFRCHLAIGGAAMGAAFRGRPRPRRTGNSLTRRSSGIGALLVICFKKNGTLAARH